LGRTSAWNRRTTLGRVFGRELLPGSRLSANPPNQPRRSTFASRQALDFATDDYSPGFYAPESAPPLPFGVLDMTPMAESARLTKGGCAIHFVVL
jgi:hypothetical protein